MASNIKIIIVGAGIGGLVLAHLFEKANIQYEILEKSTKTRAVGSPLFLHASTLYLFKQLGLYDDVVNASVNIPFFDIYNKNRDMIGKLDFSQSEKR